jgi:hypothetical protein
MDMFFASAGVEGISDPRGKAPDSVTKTRPAPKRVDLLGDRCHTQSKTVDKGRPQLYPLYFHGTPQSHARVTRVTDAEPRLL